MSEEKFTVTVCSEGVEVTISTVIGVKLEDIWYAVRAALYGSGFHRDSVAELVGDDV